MGTLLPIFTEIKIIIRAHHEQFVHEKLDNQDEKDKILETRKLSTLAGEETASLNTVIINKKTESSILKNFYKEKSRSRHFCC